VGDFDSKEEFGCACRLDMWANLSEDRCRFVMVKDKRWDWIVEVLQ